MNNTAVDPVGPSPVVRLVMGPLTKMLNPMVGKLAGRRRFRMAAQLHHVGRRSGTRYVTPVGARLNGDSVLIPLTFGNQSDWARNVYAAGECGIELNGKTYHVVRPRFVAAADAAPLARPAFNPVERFVFRVLGIRQFMQLQVVPR
jgi:deazaflavin-dependent oxidoreductase (nitroreductase family)